LKSVALLSGGLDSTVALAQGLLETEVVLALTFDYGQKAARRECEAASGLAAHWGIPHRVIDLPFLAEITGTALVRGEVPEPAADLLDDLVQARATASAVWVPNRNGLFLNVAACFAESLGAGLIITGFNREEAVTFPDNSQEFVAAANGALAFSTANQVKVLSFTQRLNKVEIVQLGRRLGVPWQWVWSCYHGGDRPCGRCESCLRFARAIRQADGEGAV